MCVIGNKQLWTIRDPVVARLLKIIFEGLSDAQLMESSVYFLTHRWKVKGLSDMPFKANLGQESSIDN